MNLTKTNKVALQLMEHLDHSKSTFVGVHDFATSRCYNLSYEYQNYYCTIYMHAWLWQKLYNKISQLV